MLADAYLKGLLAAHHDGRAESAAAWTPADFVSCTEVRQTACHETHAVGLSLSCFLIKHETGQKRTSTFC